MTESELEKVIQIKNERERLEKALKTIENNRESLRIGYVCATEEWVKDNTVCDILKNPLLLAMDTVKREVLNLIAEKTKELTAMGIVPDDADRKECENDR